MKPRYVRGVSLQGYGVSLSLGVGIPIPILNEDILRRTTVQDRDILAPVVDYSHDYPERTGRALRTVNYEDLKKGEITVKGKKVQVGSLSSYSMALEIAFLLKEEIERGTFLIAKPLYRLPLDQKMTPLEIRNHSR